MLTRVIDWSLRNRLVVLLATAALIVAGVLLSTALTASAQTRPKQSGQRDAAQKLLQEMQGAIEFVGAMANACGSGTFDEQVTIGIGAGAVKPIDGFKR